LLSTAAVLCLPNGSRERAGGGKQIAGKAVSKDRP